LSTAITESTDLTSAAIRQLLLISAVTAFHPVTFISPLCKSIFFLDTRNILQFCCKHIYSTDARCPYFRLSGCGHHVLLRRCFISAFGAQ